LFQSYLMFMFQLTLMVCIITEINAITGMPHVAYPALFLAKFVTSVAMHLSVYQEFRNGMIILKYVMNNEAEIY